MKTNPTPIRLHVQKLLKDPAAMARWEGLVIGAAQRTKWLKRLLHTPSGFGLFATIGNVSGDGLDLKVALRRLGAELGTIKLAPNENPSFELKAVTQFKDDSKLKPVFEKVQTILGPTDWDQLVGGCDWTLSPVRRFLACMRKQPLPDSIKEQPLEDSLIQSFSRKKIQGRFWFDYCALAEPKASGQPFPFKFKLPVIVDQDNGRANREGRWEELILTPRTYGAPDILMRCQTVLGGGRQRLGVLELKKARPSHAEVALLQGYAYAVAISELQKIYAKNERVHRALRTCLGYQAGRPATIPLAVYALVEERDVPAVKHDKNLLTKAVLSECGEILVGILGYKLNQDTKLMELTSAVQWVKGEWTDIKASAQRKFVRLVA